MTRQTDQEWARNRWLVPAGILAALALLVVGGSHFWLYLLHHRDSEVEALIAPLAREAREHLESTGQCPKASKMQARLGERAEYEVTENDCVFRYWAGFDDYYYFSVRKGRWYSSDEIRGCLQQNDCP